MASDEFQVAPVEMEDIERVWRERWGGALIVSVRRDYRPADVQGLGATDAHNNLLALVTWHMDGAGVGEVVSLDAIVPGKRFGRRLLREVVERLRTLGAQRIVLFTTNDNVAAIRMYLLEGWRVVDIHTDAMDSVRAKKPEVPLVGMHGLPLQDMWELTWGAAER